jgi:polysaccharide export outer membrane protein
MRSRARLELLLLAAIFYSPAPLSAQLPTERPSPAQAQVLLQTRPDLVAQLRQRFVTSGMTREQVHARLNAEGYPETLLDAYLPGSTGAASEPGDDVFKAARALGVADAADIAALQGQLGGVTAQVANEGKVGAISIARDTINKARGDADGFAIFGLDLFRAPTTQFEPNLSGPIDANYRLGPGDKLVLILTGDVESSYSLDVTREGFVVIPQVGQVYVANLTLGSLETLLYTRLSRVYSRIQANNQGTTRFSLSVAKLRSNQVFVIGEVQRPGSYQISSAATALTALYASGGPTVNGSLRTVEVRRNGRAVDTLDVYDYLLRGDASHDVRLETGDVLFIPVHGTRVRIVGEILRPATYELKGAESLSDLVRDAGGFQVTAARRHVLIERILPPNQRSEEGRDRITIDVSSASLLGGSGGSVPLQNGDVVRIFPISGAVRDQVAVTGNVREPGVVAFATGMKISDAIRKAGGLPANTYLGEMLISRRHSDGSREMLRATLVDTLGNVANDFRLQEYDSLVVYSVETFRPARYVAIAGAVRSGGRFPYRVGMTLRDLVLLADGVQESAYLREAEIARLPESRDSGRTAVTIRVPLDSTYLFERATGVGYVGPPGLQTASSGAPDVLLKPYDNVLILRQPDWELGRTVVLTGEVKFPGAYALRNKSERLSDLIARAGGLSDEANSDGIVFVRAQNGVGRVGIDLAAALRRYDSNDNLILRDGDNISVPAINLVVSIRGAVNQPSTVAYVSGKDIDYYINAAGGTARNGDEGHAYVTQPSGKLESVQNHFLRPASVPQPRPGSVVTVPERDPADKKDYIAIVGTVAQVVASFVAIIVAIKR